MAGLPPAGSATVCMYVCMYVHATGNAPSLIGSLEVAVYALGAMSWDGRGNCLLVGMEGASVEL